MRELSLVWKAPGKDMLFLGLLALAAYANSFAKQHLIWPYDNYHKDAVFMVQTERTGELEKELCAEPLPRNNFYDKPFCSVLQREDNDDFVYVLMSVNGKLENAVEYDAETKEPVRELEVRNTGNSGVYVFSEENYSGKIDLVEEM